MQIRKHNIATKLLVLLIIASNNLNGQVKNRNEFILKGKVNYPSDRFIYFVWYNADEQGFLDSAKVTNGEFYYKAISNGYLDRFYIKTNPSVKSNNDYQNNVKVPIDNSIMNLELKIGQFSKYKLIGCRSCDLLNERANYYETTYDKPNEKYQKIIADYRVSSVIRRKYEKLYSNNNSKAQKEILAWCIKNPDNNLTPLELLSYLGHNESLNFEKYYNKLTEFQKNSFYGQSLRKEIAHNIFLTNLTGTTAPNFEKLGFDSSSVRLATINQNSYVLLDFWGSWCTPCRASHPNLIKLYKKYHSSNFNIIGIAVDDDNISSWKKAIKQDSIYIWNNILSGHQSDKSLNENQDLCKQYYIQVYPTKVLIDTSGKIVGRYVGENFEELAIKLKSIYGY